MCSSGPGYWRRIYLVVIHSPGKINAAGLIAATVCSPRAIHADSDWFYRAGEYKIAEDLLQAALQQARDNRGISGQTMTDTLLVLDLGTLSGSHTRKALHELISFQLDSIGEDAFVVTRACWFSTPHFYSRFIA